MRAIGVNSKSGFCIAAGAAASAVHFGGLTANLGPIVGMTVSAIILAAIVVGAYAALELAVGPATHVPGSR